jgi:hypothetical protein
MLRYSWAYQLGYIVQFGNNWIAPVKDEIIKKEQLR